MPILRKPSLIYPSNIVTSKDIIRFMKTYHSNSEHISKAEEMIRNTEIDKRHLFISFDDVMKLNKFGSRQSLYEEIAKSYATKVAKEALQNAQLKKEEITMVIVTSCTGFMMPSLTAHLINELDLNRNVVQLPIAQMGCVGGSYAINRAFEHCRSSKNNNALILALEASSLCFHREESKLQDFISDAIFGDGAASAVMRGDGVGEGFKIENTESVFLKHTEYFIKYKLIDNGFLFSLDKSVMYSVDMVKDDLNRFIERNISYGEEIGFCISHTGGKRIIDEVTRCLNLPKNLLNKSRESLKTLGNTSSVSVIDVFGRHFGSTSPKEKGVLLAFGPGFTAEISIGQWQAAS
ncbi:type III polyketide synthase [Enterovibrio nigricans]|uniref:Type III polyketide synthase n=1 Tax=Enterovibrio nigricans DSM 22720 TaxID=1121868 RepID=A0A1T4VXR8_9GAMM|nr:type III polyketide synthase [Enterovibrio nigricans]PKF49211.1 type III polyketide synthase [Enterovibrio nigricans]SKA69786.1 type III polyketide synthase [Enterovibrio nigricans DSM 22720]